MPITIRNLVADAPLLKAAINTDRSFISISRTWIEQINFESKNVILSDVFDSSNCDLVERNRLRLDLALPGHAGLTVAQPEAGVPIGSSEFLTDSEFQQREKQNLIAAIEHSGWRVSGDGGAADSLEIKASTLTYRMKALEVEKPKGLS